MKTVSGLMMMTFATLLLSLFTTDGTSTPPLPKAHQDKKL